VVAPFPMRFWDGDYVVYNPLSGNTHTLDVVAGEVLKAITSGALSVSELCAHLAQFLEVPNDERIASHVADIVRALDELGLIEPVGGC